MAYIAGKNGSYVINGSSVSAKIVWNETYDIEENASYISIDLYFTSEIYGGNPLPSGAVFINGEQVVVMDNRQPTHWCNQDMYKQWAKVEAYGNQGTPTPWSSLKIYHNQDGSATIPITISDLQIYTNRLFNIGNNRTDIELTKIPRGAVITSAPNFNDEENPTFEYNNPAGESIDSLRACIADAQLGVLIPYREISKVDKSYTYNFTAEEKQILLDYCNDANSKGVYFYLQTNIGGNSYYSTSYKTFSIINNTPGIKYSVKDINTATTSLTGNDQVIVKGQSNIQIESAGVPLKGATIVRNSIFYNGYWYEGIGSATINKAYDGNFKFWTRDSRGNEKYESKELKVLDYFKPNISLTVNGILTGDKVGTLKIRLSGHFFNQSFGLTQNTLNLWYRYKINGGDYTGWGILTPVISGNEFSCEVELTNVAYKDNYVIQGAVADKLNPDIRTNEISTSILPVFNYNKHHFNFNVPLQYEGKNIDFIVEQGISADGWAYRKWNNGVGEAWGNGMFSGAIQDTWGPFYYGCLSTAYKYPIDFVEPPVELVNVQSNHDILLYSTNIKNTATNCGVYGLIGGTPLEEISGYYQYYIKGYYK